MATPATVNGTSAAMGGRPIVTYPQPASAKGVRQVTSVLDMQTDGAAISWCWFWCCVSPNALMEQLSKRAGHAVDILTEPRQPSDDMPANQAPTQISEQLQRQRQQSFVASSVQC
mmetsp:Transcript_7026/g.15947  ORF Transcript_7026/g.15947 Transcript_7026/m.15947 type:complete len:115 (+) Transcript_7026:53-397(+)